MIAGTVNPRLDAVVRLRVRGPGGAESSFDAVIDTGFSEMLTLPAASITSLGLTLQSTGRATLADGTVYRHGYFAAEVEWDGSWRPILVSAVGNEVLIGMGLLAGCELRVAVVPGGAVAIAPLP